MWRAAWMCRWFVQAALSCSGGSDRVDPHTDIPLHCAHTLVEVEGPPVIGGGTNGQCSGSNVPQGGVPALWQRDQEGEDTGADENMHGSMGAREAKEGETEEKDSRWKLAGAMQGGCMRDARAPHRRCAEDPVGLTLAATRIRS